MVYLVLKSLCRRNRQGNHKLKLLFVCVCVHVHVHVHAYTGTQWEMVLSMRTFMAHSDFPKPFRRERSL